MWNWQTEGEASLVKRIAAWILAAATLTACAPHARPTTAPVTGVPRTASASVASQQPFDIGMHYQFILDSQRDSGAIAMNPQQLLINPYFANLAAKALLYRPDSLPHVQRYMEWYVAHLNPDGTIDDYRVVDTREVATGDADSTDSYAATFLSLVNAWVEAGGDVDWVVQNRRKLDKVVTAIIAVTDKDGLTWAKPGHFMKFLMDNCEVYRGWMDWSALMQRLGDPSAAAARRKADRILAALPRFKQADGNWGYGINRFGSLHSSNTSRRFYPDAVAQVFPLAFGLTEEGNGYQALDGAQPRWRHLEASDFPWLLPAYAAALAGDKQAAREALKLVAELHPTLTWPWFIAESAWVIETFRVMN